MVDPAVQATRFDALDHEHASHLCCSKEIGMSKIAIVIPYFGKLPAVADYFFASAGHAQDLDVLLFTDAAPSANVPSNVKVHAFTTAGFNDLASRQLGIPIQVSSPYKLCDFRPAYGVIFQEYLGDYEFWGFGDVDVIYGDVARVLGPILAGHDIISCRKGWTSGAFCILRNSPTVNSAYRCSADWARALAARDYQFFDELGGRLFNVAQDGTDVGTHRGNVEAFTQVAKRLQRDGLLRCSFQDLVCEDLDWGESLVFDQGRITRCRDGADVLCVHTVKMKRRFFYLPSTEIDRGRFFIRKTGIYPAGQPTTSRFIEEVGRILRGGSSCLGRLLRRRVSWAPSGGG